MTAKIGGFSTATKGRAQIEMLRYALHDKPNSRNKYYNNVILMPPVRQKNLGFRFGRHALYFRIDTGTDLLYTESIY